MKLLSVCKFGKFISTIEGVLHCDVHRHNSRLALSRALWSASIMVVLFGGAYGFAMGSYGAVVGEKSWLEQSWQMLYSAIKVSMLIGVTVGVSLPSYFVFNSLFGLRDDFRLAVIAILETQASLLIILASLFPVTLLAYVSFGNNNSSYPLAILWNGFCFGLASLLGQGTLRQRYRILIERNSRHRIMLWLWIFIYSFVGVQAGYVLRPFIGSPQQPVSFFRRESFQNAYVKVYELCLQVLDL